MPPKEPTDAPSIAATTTDLASMLAPTLGHDKSEELVRVAAAEMGVAGTALDHDQALSVIDRLSETPGLIGVAARFVRTRYLARLSGTTTTTTTAAIPSVPTRRSSTTLPRVGVTVSGAPQATPPRGTQAPLASAYAPHMPLATSHAPHTTQTGGPFGVVGGPRNVYKTLELDVLIPLLVPSLDAEKSEELITQTARSLGFPADVFDRTQALAIFEALGETPGLVGVTARFSKARVLMLFVA